MTICTRSKLLGSAMSAVAGIAALTGFAAPASAQCTFTTTVLTNDTLSCDPTTTANTSYPTNAATGTDRYYISTGGDPAFVYNGVINGYGLSVVTDGVLTAASDGVIVDAGDPTAGGTAALNLSGTEVYYLGAGLAINNFAGNGLEITANDSDGGIAVDADVINGGSAANGSAIVINQVNAAGGSVTLDVGGNVTASNGNGISVTSNGVGDIDINNAAAITEGAGGDLFNGIYANHGGAGNILVDNSGNIGTSTARADNGIVTTHSIDGDTTITNSGAIYADQVGIDATTTGTGDVNVTTTGLIDSGGIGINAVSAGGDVMVTDSAALTSAGTGVAATTTGAGNVTVTRTGTSNLTSTGGVGISTNAGTGTTTISTGTGTTSGATSGIQAVSTGTQSITANGNVSGGTVAGIHSDTTANRVITVAAGRTVSGGAEAVLLTNTGTSTINNSGTIGAASTGLAVQATGAGAATINNLAGATLNGRLLLTANADSVGNAGTFNTQGTTDFGAGSDSLANNTGGIINLTGATTFANLEALGNQGTINVNNALTFTGSAPTIGNAGTINLGANVTGAGAVTNQTGGTINLNGRTITGTGAFVNNGTITGGATGAGLLGFTTQSNAGTFNLAPGTNTVSGAYTNSGTINAIVGTSTLTGQTSFTNTGLINLQDGAANDQLTINSSFNGGAGSTLAVDTSDTTSDLLVITGAISGTTTVDANLIGTGALVVGGVQVVDGQSTSTDGAFVLGDITGNAGPLTSYEIVQDGSDYYLNGSLTAAGFEPLSAAAMVPDLWHPSADEVFANLNVPYKGEPGLGGWVQGYVSRDKRGDRDFGQTVGGIDYSVDTRVKTTHYGLQGGVDYGLGGTTRVGLTAGYGQHNGKGVVDIDAKGWNVGLYAGFGGVSGFHGDFLAKHDRYKLEFQDGTFEGDRLVAKANGIEGQLGYRMPMGGAEDSNLDITAGLSHVWNKLDGVSAFGLDYSYDDLDSIRGRVGARYNVGGAMQPYVSATLLHEFSRNGTLYVDDGINALAFETRKKGTWGRIEGGIGGTPNGFPMIAAWADLGDVKGIGARLGMRFGASAPAPAPAPVIAPPAPVEPAPATQTCYDGSVILATDVCPVPPPPPAPVVTPERG